MDDMGEFNRKLRAHCKKIKSIEGSRLVLTNREQYNATRRVQNDWGTIARKEVNLQEKKRKE